MGSTEEESGSTKEVSEVGLLSEAQTKRLVKIISAAKATLDDCFRCDQICLAIPESKPSDQRRLQNVKLLTVSMWILVLATALCAVLVLAASLYLARHSKAPFVGCIILGVAYIVLGISAVATCVVVLARDSLLRKK